MGLKGERVNGLETRYGLFEEVYLVSSGKFRRYHGESLLAHLTDVKTLLLNARDLVKVVGGTITARRLLKKLKPTVVFSKGGYAVVPVGIAAHGLGIPIVTHDSDTLPGLANRIIGRWASVHATGMPTEYYSYPKSKMRYTGIPVVSQFDSVSLSDKEEYKKQLAIPTPSTVLMVAGGGQGSRTVNNMVINSASQLFVDVPQLFIIHLSGKTLEHEVKTGYGENLNEACRARVRVVGFTDELYKFSAASDLVVARTGASTLAELAMQGRAVVAVPSPFLSGGHQLKNAEMLKKQHAAEIAHEDIPPEDFTKLITRLLNDKSARQLLATNLHALAKPHAARDIAQILLNFASKDQ